MNSNRHKRIAFATAVSAVLLSVAIASLSFGGEGGEASAGPCVTWRQEARFVGVAYNHLVHLTNHCDKGAVCRIKTDVNPQSATVSLKPKEKKTHVTFRGSPARTFKAEVVCVEK